MNSLNKINGNLRLVGDDIKELLEFSKPSKLYAPLKNYPFYLHWSNSDKLTKKIKSSLKDEYIDVTENYNQFLDKFEELKAVPIWLKVEDKILPMKLYDIYQTFIDFIHKDKFEEQLFCNQEVSFIGPCGPFMNTSLIDFINKYTLNDLIGLKVLTNKIPQRKIRLATEGKVIMYYGDQLTDSSIMYVRQITDGGILFSSKNDLLLDTISSGELVKFLIDTTEISKIINGDQEDNIENRDLYFTTENLRYFFIEERKISKNLGYDSSKTGEFYFFCRYHDMLESDAPNIFREFINQFNQNLFENAA